MLKLAADENFNNDILRGLLRRVPALDLVRIQDVDLGGADDPTVLEWAAQEGRVLLTHDVTTMSDFAYQRVEDGNPMPGIFQVSQRHPVRTIVEDILIATFCSLPGEWEGLVLHLPWR